MVDVLLGKKHVALNFYFVCIAGDPTQGFADTGQELSTIELHCHSLTTLLLQGFSKLFGS